MVKKNFKKWLKQFCRICRARHLVTDLQACYSNKTVNVKIFVGASCFSVIPTIQFLFNHEIVL